ncbi:hypothetical protein H0H92_012682 [Tricholoma furcatifolium]|nr:hypothetical protein H0H92_012682 [Tricholoma furcatifolium]
MSTPTPLLPTTISLVLHYIAPLSPLPPHIISSALAQRHHFLNITTDDPAQYLAWPSDNPNAQQIAVDLLDSVQNTLHHLDFTIRYTSDPESTFAHAAISGHDPPPLRLVFQWHSSEGWKFHNLALMPFPPNSYDSVEDPMLFKSHTDDPANDQERDSYWDAYGLSDETDDETGVKSKQDTAPPTEDAYWAQYSTVHGSGDSAIPTPPAVHQKLDNERTILPYSRHCTSSVYNPLSPPSPRTLAGLLANLSPRSPSPISIADDSDSGFGSASASASGESSSPILSPPSHPSISISSADEPSTVNVALSSQMSSETSRMADRPSGEDDEARNAVKDAIRGVYHLWKVTRVDGGRQEFLEIVQQSLTQT